MFIPENQFEKFSQKPKPNYILSDRRRQTSKQPNCSNMQVLLRISFTLASFKTPLLMGTNTFLNLLLNTHGGQKLGSVK